MYNECPNNVVIVGFCYRIIWTFYYVIVCLFFLCLLLGENRKLHVVLRKRYLNSCSCTQSHDIFYAINVKNCENICLIYLHTWKRTEKKNRYVLIFKTKKYHCRVYGLFWSQRSKKKEIYRMLELKWIIKKGRVNRIYQLRFLKKIWT